MPDIVEAEVLAAGAAKLLGAEPVGALADEVGELLSSATKGASRSFGRVPVSLSRIEELRAIPKVNLHEHLNAEPEFAKDLLSKEGRRFDHPFDFAANKDIDIAPSVNGKAEIIFDNATNGVRKVTFTPDMSIEQRKQQILVASFAHLLKSDPDLIESVSTVPGRTIGFLPHGMVLASDAEMQEQAVKGAQAFIKGEPGSAYTRVLRSSFGHWTSKDTSLFMQLSDDSGRKDVNRILSLSRRISEEDLFGDRLPIVHERL